MTHTYISHERGEVLPIFCSCPSSANNYIVLYTLSIPLPLQLQDGRGVIQTVDEDARREVITTRLYYLYSLSCTRAKDPTVANIFYSHSITGRDGR